MSPKMKCPAPDRNPAAGRVEIGNSNTYNSGVVLRRLARHVHTHLTERADVQYPREPTAAPCRDHALLKPH